jgi:hypothetical protein
MKRCCCSCSCSCSIGDGRLMIGEESSSSSSSSSSLWWLMMKMKKLSSCFLFQRTFSSLQKSNQTARDFLLKLLFIILAPLTLPSYTSFIFVYSNLLEFLFLLLFFSHNSKVLKKYKKPMLLYETRIRIWVHVRYDMGMWIFKFF